MFCSNALCIFIQKWAQKGLEDKEIKFEAKAKPEFKESGSDGWSALCCGQQEEAEIVLKLRTKDS